MAKRRRHAHHHVRAKGCGAKKKAYRKARAEARKAAGRVRSMTRRTFAACRITKPAKRKSYGPIGIGRDIASIFRSNLQMQDILDSPSYTEMMEEEI